MGKKKWGLLCIFRLLRPQDISFHVIGIAFIGPARGINEPWRDIIMVLRY